MERQTSHTLPGLKATFAETLEDLAQYLKYQNELGNRAINLSGESRTLVEKWGTPGWRAGHRFSCQGPENADLMIVDSKAGFFNGPAGALLVKILKAMHQAPESVFICSADNKSAIRAHLSRHRHKCILCLGEKAGHTLIECRDPLADLRGRFFSFGNTPVMVSHHPCELIENQGLKRHVWDDVQQVMAKIGE